MPTLLLFVLAVLSLLAGAMIEPPVAKAASRLKPASVTAEQLGYRIVLDEVLPESGRRYVEVTLPKRIAEAELIRIAGDVRAREKTAYERTVVNFYLPGMQIGQGAWAVATYNPTFKLNIAGLRLDEAQAAAAEAAADTRNLIGAWLTAPPAAPGRLTLYRRGGKIFAERRLRDHSISTAEVIEGRDTRGRRYSPVEGGTDFFLLTWSGEMELHDGATLIAAAERIPLRAEVAASPVVAVTNAPTHQPRRRSALRETAQSVVVRVERDDRH